VLGVVAWHVEREYGHVTVTSTCMRLRNYLRTCLPKVGIASLAVFCLPGSYHREMNTSIWPAVNRTGPGLGLQSDIAVPRDGRSRCVMLTGPLVLAYSSTSTYLYISAKYLVIDVGTSSPRVQAHENWGLYVGSNIGIVMHVEMDTERSRGMMLYHL